MTEPDIIGRIGGPQGLEVKARLDDDAVRGRVGGAFGKDVDLSLHDDRVQGRVGGTNGFDVTLKLERGELVGSLGAEDFVLRGVDRVTGRIGSALSGLDFDLQQLNTRLIGSLGTKDVDLSLGGSPGWIGALVAVIAVYALERHQN
jgi:hypothetical protein